MSIPHVLDMCCYILLTSGCSVETGRKGNEVVETMMLPTTYAVALLLTILTMLCWGSWANTIKLAGKWRFELYYFDYALGVLLAATIAAFTFGSIEGAVLSGDVPGFSFQDNLLVSSKTQMAYAVVGGVVFNLANILLVAAIAVAGMSVAFPIGIGLALIIGVLLNYLIKPAGNPGLLFGGSGVVLLAIIACALAHSLYQRNKAAASVPEATGVRPVTRGRPRRTSPFKGVALSLVSGFFMGLFFPLVELSKTGDIGLGPYAAAFLFAVGVVLSTPVFNAFMMNMPVEGPPVRIVEYFAGTFKQHALGWLGGMIWCAGAICSFVAASTPKTVNVGPAVSYAIGQGATLVSMLWGLLVWKEFAGASGGVWGRIVLTLILFVIGLGMVSIAPLYK